MRYIDAHVHFFDTSRPEGLLWPSPTSPIFRSHLPKDLVDIYRDSECDGVIAVETSTRFSDDKWLFEQAKNNDFIKGVIANLDIDSENFEQNLEYAVGHKKFKGIRLRPIKNINLEDHRVQQNLKYLPDSANVVEAGCPNLKTFEQFAKLANDNPKLNFVVVHFGHPKLTSSSNLNNDWLDGIKLFSAQKNCFCKLTSLLQFKSDNEAQAEYFKPTLDALKQNFGKERLIYGSNWPPVEMEGGWKRNMELLSELFSEEESESVFFHNAQKIYLEP